MERANIGLSAVREEAGEMVIDEIAHYQDCKYVGAIEAKRRLLKYPMMHRTCVVVRLTFILLGRE